MPLRGRSEPNAARLQDDLSCFRIAAADEAACRDVGVGVTQGSVQGSAVGLVQPVARIQREELDLSSVGEICGFIHNKAPSADSSLQSHEWNASTREVGQQAVGAGRQATGSSSPSVRGCRSLNGRSLARAT